LNNNQKQKDIENHNLSDGCIKWYHSKRNPAYLIDDNDFKKEEWDFK
jgi:hypothetical protein